MRRVLAVGVLLPVVALAMISIAMRAQGTDGALPAFEVATIKPPDPSVRTVIYPPGAKQETLLPGTGRLFVARAYEMVPNSKVRVLGGPAWIDSDRYMILGKISDDIFAKMQTMSNTEKEHQVNLMLRSLLSERFKLKVHSETREMPIYELVAAKNGPKMDALKPIDAAGGGMSWGKGEVRVASTLQDAFQMSPFGLEGRPVVNKTGLTGTYRFTLKWTPPPMPGANAAAQPVADSEPEASIFTVIQEQLGLKLVPAKGPVEVIVIDSIERPSEN